MPFQPALGAGLAVVRGTFTGGEPLQNVFAFFLDGTLTQDLADDVATALGLAYSEIDNFTSDVVTYHDVEVTDIRTETGPQFISTAGAFPITGAATGHGLPYQTAALVSWSTESRGRSFRGRTYIGGFTEAHSNGNGIDTALVTALEAFADAMLDPPVVSFGVLSRYHNNALRDDAIWTAFTGRRVHTSWRSQRRRNPLVG